MFARFRIAFQEYAFKQRRTRREALATDIIPPRSERLKKMYDGRKLQLPIISQKPPEEEKIIIKENPSTSELLTWKVERDATSGGFSTARLLGGSEGNYLFQGNIDTRRGPKMKFSGFAAAFAPEETKPLLLHDFNALETCCRSDGRMYHITLKSLKFGIPVPDMFQFPLVLPPKACGWYRVQIPLDAFMLSMRNGSWLENANIAYDPDTNREFIRIGVVVQDFKDGPFRFEFKYFRALRLPEEELPQPPDTSGPKRYSLETITVS